MVQGQSQIVTQLGNAPGIDRCVAGQDDAVGAVFNPVRDHADRRGDDWQAASDSFGQAGRTAFKVTEDEQGVHALIEGAEQAVGRGLEAIGDKAHGPRPCRLVPAALTDENKAEAVGIKAAHQGVQPGFALDATIVAFGDHAQTDPPALIGARGIRQRENSAVNAMGDNFDPPGDAMMGQNTLLHLVEADDSRSFPPAGKERGDAQPRVTLARVVMDGYNRIGSQAPFAVGPMIMVNSGPRSRANGTGQAHVIGRRLRQPAIEVVKDAAGQQTGGKNVVDVDHYTKHETGRDAQGSPARGYPSSVRRKSLFEREIWTLGLVRQAAADIVENGMTAPIEWLPVPPSRTFLADPWARTRPDGSLTMLAEHMDYRSGKGTIVGVDLAPGEPFFNARFLPIAEAAAHLSYPTVTPWQNRWLMMTESWEADGIPVYSAQAPEGPWSPETRMLDGVPAIDPTLVEWQGHWYLFLTRHDDGPNVRLDLMTGPTPLGPWTPHPQTPVKVDIGSARPAGPLFRDHRGALIRPAQDCRQTYGGAVMLNRIVALTPEAFREEPVRRIAPDPASPWPDGLHTFCEAGPVTLVDGKRWEWSLLEPLHKLRAIGKTKARRAAAMAEAGLQAAIMARQGEQ